MRQLRTATLMILMTVLASTLWSPSRVRATSEDDVATKVGQLLDQSGYTYKKYNDTTWSINFQKSYLSNFKVIIATGTSIVVTFAIVAKKAQMRRSNDLLFMLLQKDHDYDYVKVGLDKDEDLFVRVDSDPRILDVERLKADVTQVANAANEIYRDVRPFLNTP